MTREKETVQGKHVLGDVEPNMVRAKSTGNALVLKGCSSLVFFDVKTRRMKDRPISFAFFGGVDVRRVATSKRPRYVDAIGGDMAIMAATS